MLGILSLIFWSLMLVVVGQVPRLRPARRQPRRGRHPGAAGARCAALPTGGAGVAALVVVLGAVRRGAALRRRHDHAGDLGAVGASKASRSPRPRSSRSSCRSTWSILVVLFAVQRRGTARVGRVFGPIMLVWFTDARRCSASQNIAERPEVLAGAQPVLRGRASSLEHGWSPSSCSASVVLASPAARRSTPTWATSARRPIRLAWFAVVLPALLLNYFGQGALLLRDPERGRRTRSTCWRRPGRCYPMVVLADRARP